MNKRNPLLKAILVFMLSFVGQWSFADGILVFQVTDARNTPLEGVKIKLSGDSTIADLEFTTDALGRYTNPKFKSGTYNYEVAYGDWAKGTVTVPEEEFGWVNVNFRELSIKFEDFDEKPIPGRTAKLYVDNNGEKGEYIDVKISDSTGIVKFLIPEGKYIYETLAGSVNVTVDDKVKTQEVSIPSGEITHKTYFEFRYNGEPYTVNTDEIRVYIPLSEEKDSLIGKVLVGKEPYSRTKKGFTPSAGKYTFKVVTKEFGEVYGTFTVDDNDSMDELIIPINIDSYVKGNGGDAGEGGSNSGDNEDEPPFEKQLAVWENEPGIATKVSIAVYYPEDTTKPIDNVFCYMEMLSVGKPMPYGVTDENGECDLYARADEDYILHVGGLQIPIDDLQLEDTTIKVLLDREDYTEIFFKVAFEGDEFNPTTINEVDFETRYETDSFYMPATLVMKPVKSTTSDTLYYTNPLRVGEGGFNFDFNINEMTVSGSRGSFLYVKSGDLTREAYYNIVPRYDVNVILSKTDSVTRYSNAFPIVINGEDEFTDFKGEFHFTTTKNDYTIKAFKETKEFLVDRDTTVYFLYDRIVQNVHFKFVHNGEIVNPNLQYLEVFVNDGSKESAGILKSKDGYVGGVYQNTFPDSLDLEEGDYYVAYTMEDFYYEGDFEWEFNVENARGTDTTIYIVIPAKRNVELIITDARGEYVESIIGKIYKYDESGEKLISTFEYDGSDHEELLSDENGVIRDHLLPGKYQLRILDIVKNFVVGDYDLKFDIRNGVPARHVKFIVKNKNTQKPMQGLELVVNKDSAQYSTDVTSATGEIEIECINGDYDYVLNYGKDHAASFTVKKDTTIYIYVEDEVKIQSLDLDAKDCLAEGGSVQLEPIITPSTATRKTLKWSIDKPVLGYIDVNGKFTANTIGLTGFVTITAKTIDGTNLSAEKMIQIGGTSCGDSIKTEFEGGVNEIARTDDSLKIIVTPGKETFKRCYAVQELQGDKWVVIEGPTQDTAIVISTVNMNEKKHTVRVISGTNCDKVSKGDVTSGDPESADQIGKELTIKNTSIFFKPGINGVCEKMDNVLIEIDGDGLDTLITGTSIKWYVQANGSNEFVAIPTATDKKSVSLNISGETTIKVALENGVTELVKAQKKIVSEDSLKIKLTATKTNACYGDAINLNVETLKGTYASILWEDNSNVAERNIAADTITYKVVAESKLGYCPNAADSMRLVVDFKPEVNLTIDRNAVCDDSSNVKLTVSSAQKRTDLIYTWNGFTSADTVLTDTPMENTTYEVTVSTALGICQSVKLNQSVAVANNVEFEAKASDSIFCKGDEFKIGITKINGGTLNDNIQFSLNGVDFNLTGDSVNTTANTLVYTLKATDLTAGCPDAYDTVRIKIDEPVEFTLSQSATTICNIGSDSVKIQVNANPATNYAYVWSTGAADTTMITVYPDVDSTYKVVANSQYGKCPSMEQTASIIVNEAINVSIEADVDRICQTGADSVKLTAIAENGEPTSWIWWDGAVTISPERTILPTTTSAMWVRGNDNVCAVSDTASVTITVDAPHTAHLATTSTKFVYGGAIDMVASFNGNVDGPITWYSETAEGDVNTLAETEELKYSDMPSGDVKYYFIAKNGACPEIKSDEMAIALVDDIEIPTVFTPYEKNGENDEFMLGYEVVIYDRFGNLIHRGDNGWDGTYKGDVADAGVYVYSLILKDGREMKGTIQVFKRD